MKTSKILLTVFIINLTVIFTSKIFAQNDLSTTLSHMSEDSSKKYSQILTNVLSADINSGMFQITKPTNKFGVYFGIKASGSFLGSDEHLPGSMKNMTIVPFAMVQLGVGSLVGTDAFFRFLPTINLGNYASINAWGIGLQHNLAKDFKKMPVEISFQVSVQHLTLKDSKDNEIANMNSWALNTSISKRIGILTLYTLFQYEKSNSNISYVSAQPTNSKVNYTLQNESNYRAVAGFNLKMGPVNLNCDYNFAKTSSVSAGLGFGF